MKIKPSKSEKPTQAAKKQGRFTEQDQKAAAAAAAFKIDGGIRLFKRALGLLQMEWKVFLVIAVIYGVLNALLVPTISSTDLSVAKDNFDAALKTGSSNALGGVGIYAYLLGTAGTSNSEVAGVYRFLLALIVSLALIWTIRQVYAGQKVTIKDGFYKGMAPFVPSLLLLGVAIIQMLPLVIGSFIYTLVVTTGGLAAGQIAAWAVFAFLTAFLSLFFVCSTLFALYIVCLPDVTPLVALRAARELVRGRRWLIMRRVAVLPIILLIVGVILLMPFIFLVTGIAGWAFLFVLTAMLPVIHSYMYLLYRELLK
jgi:hypothetical protein